MNKWFLVYCKPQQDSRAEENLLRQGYNVFRPMINVVKPKIGSRSLIKSESLFPRYLFINVDVDSQSISPVFSTFGVSSFVRFGNQYATASDELIDEIKQNAEQQIVISNSQNTLKHGDEIYVHGNGFDQVKAIYCSPCGNQRALILMNIMGRESKLQIATDYIRKVKQVAQ